MVLFEALNLELRYLCFQWATKLCRGEKTVKIVAHQKIPLGKSSPIECVNTPPVVQKTQRRYFWLQLWIDHISQCILSDFSYISFMCLCQQKDIMWQSCVIFKCGHKPVDQFLFHFMISILIHFISFLFSFSLAIIPSKNFKII